MREPTGPGDERPPLWERLFLSSESGWITTLLLTIAFAGMALTTTSDALRVVAWVVVGINIVTALLQFFAERRRKAVRRAEASDDADTDSHTDEPLLR